MSVLDATLVRAALNGLEMPVVAIETAGGMDHASHVANLVPAADHELTGRRAYEDTWRVPFLRTLSGWGELYPQLFREVMFLLETQRAGEYLRLRHPFLGTFPVLVHGWRLLGKPDVQSGAWLEFSWKEQTDSASLDLDRTPDPDRDLFAKARAADDALSDVGIDSTFVTDVGRFFADAAEGELLPADQFALLDAMERRARGLLALPTLAVSALPGFSAMHRAVVAIEHLLVTVTRWRTARTPDPARVRVYVTPHAMSAGEVALALYGSLSLGALVRAANPHADAEYPAGTRLTINPR